MKLTFKVNLFLLLLLLCQSIVAGDNPKREFRGAWIQAVNGQYLGMDRDETKRYLTTMLDNLKRANVNAIIFQVRVEGDALYRSNLEPWSRFLTGTQGKDPGWDPLEFMVAESHARGMELHAWINPYRARTKGTLRLSPAHQFSKHPERFIGYESQLFFNPSLQENRDWICKVVKDIVSRYDVDALHIDDYFYPYPVGGKEFNDEMWFKKDSRGIKDKGDWRRDNVNRLIYQMHRTVRETKPWVKFGVSPFGIYRNISSSPTGSDTKGLESYDALYADVLHWVNEGWVDYCIPQVYWEIGHTAADYETLVRWWAKYASNRPLYIGQDVNRTVRAADPKNSRSHQMPAKMALQRSLPAVQGSCLWDAASAAKNVGRYRDVLEQHYHSSPALMPKYKFIDSKAPKKVKGVKRIKADGNDVLVWITPNKENTKEMDKAVNYVVYRFAKGEKVNLEKAANIVAITPHTYYNLPKGDSGKFTYVVTALDRLHNESKGKKVKVSF
ncbi:MAG: hypothetical protein E7092_08260 [Bacteroidales bacterium]|nr:hypothetical protein [Bacteroidales bacterium]